MDQLFEQRFFNILITICGLLGGWLFKVLYDSHNELKQEDRKLAEKVNAIEVLVVGAYVKREELTACMLEIRSMFAKIFDRLEDKEDKER